MAEYEAASVPEYWIIDPGRERCIFYQLDGQQRYQPAPLDADDIYRTARLPGLALHVPTLWQASLPNYFEVGEAVRAMLAD